MKFEPNKRTIGELYYEPRTNYEIPKYQRPYSWKKEQFEEFWKLILDGESTFIGTVIYNVADTDSTSVKEIIDGQQRYLTITILAAALRDAILEESKSKGDSAIEKKAEDVQEELIGKRNKRTDEYENYLIVGASAKTYFESNIQRNPSDFKGTDEEEINLSKPDTEEEKLIFNAYWYFKEKIKSHFEIKDLKQVLNDILTNLEKLFVVSIEIDDYAMAFEIFESVNSQGVDLSVADLIKNQIFRNLSSEDHLKAEERWAEIIDNLESVEMNISPKEFLRYYWASKYSYVGDSKLYLAIKKKFKSNSKEWSNFLQELTNDSRTIVELLNNNKGDWQQELNKKDGAKMYKYVKALKSLKAKTWLVLMLSILRKRKEFNKEGVKYINQVEKIQMFTFLYFGIMNFAGNWYWIQMYTTAQKIYNASNKAEMVKAFEDLNKSFGSKTHITKEAFVDGFRGITYKNYGMVRYILGEIEQSLRGDGSTGWDDDLVNIEHFLPQDPKNWGLKKSDIKSYVNSIGNLVLISSKLNGKLGNKTCKEKLEVIEEEKAEMELLKQLVSNIKNKTWDFDSITKDDYSAITFRQEYLDDQAFDIWVNGTKKKLGY